MSFFKDMILNCFHCNEWFLPIGFDFTKHPEEASRHEFGQVCGQCGWHVCPHCDQCKCQLGEEGVRVAEAMLAQYLRWFKKLTRRSDIE